MNKNDTIKQQVIDWLNSGKNFDIGIGILAGIRPSMARIFSKREKTYGVKLEYELRKLAGIVKNTPIVRQAKEITAHEATQNAQKTIQLTHGFQYMGGRITPSSNPIVDKSTTIKTHKAHKGDKESNLISAKGGKNATKDSQNVTKLSKNDTKVSNNVTNVDQTENDTPSPQSTTLEGNSETTSINPSTTNAVNQPEADKPYNNQDTTKNVESVINQTEADQTNDNQDTTQKVESEIKNETSGINPLEGNIAPTDTLSSQSTTLDSTPSTSEKSKLTDTKPFIIQIEKEHAHLVKLRSQLADERSSVPQTNVPKNNKKRKVLSQSIAQISDRIELLFKAKDDFYTKGTVPDMNALFPSLPEKKEQSNKNDQTATGSKDNQKTTANKESKKATITNESKKATGNKENKKAIDNKESKKVTDRKGKKNSSGKKEADANKKQSGKEINKDIKK